MLARFHLVLAHLLLIAAGSLTTLSFAPYTQWWLPVFSLALLAYFTQNASNAKRAALLGFSFGLGWFGAGISWVHVSIEQFGGLPLIGSLGVMALLVSYLALFPAFSTWLSFTLKQSAFTPLIFAACWTIGELLRSVAFTGFPWLSMGYSQTDLGLSDLAPIIGQTGISFLLVFSGAALAQLLSKQPAISRYSYVIVAGLLFAFSPQLKHVKGWFYNDDSLSVVLVQGNIKQSLRWEEEQEWPTMLKYMDMTRLNFQADLIIWPEAAIPRLEPLAGDFLENLDRSAFYQNTAVISGIIDYNFKTQEAWNNLIVLGKRTKDVSEGHYFYNHANRYSKHHLLPIGEFVPFENWLRKIAPLFDLPMSSFSRGSYIQPNLVANSYHLLPAICFEIAFPNQIAANMTDNTQLILTVSNDAWFGASIGPHQHLQIAQMRAKEFGRPVLRATNNGITAVITPSGEISSQAEQFTEAVLKDNVPLTSGKTLYSRLGDKPLLALCFTLIALFGFNAWRRNKNA